MTPSISPPSVDPLETAVDWHRSLALAVRDRDELLRRLELPNSVEESPRQATAHFPLLAPLSYLRRMRKGDPNDPLLRQILPIRAEEMSAEGFVVDAVGDSEARLAPGLLQKYAGRALFIATGACAIHCRYCFRRHYPYAEDPRRLQDWQPAFERLAADESIVEVILSGGDPLMLTDHRLGQLIERLEAIPHLRRLRIHSRLPIVLPDRVTPALLKRLGETRLRTVMVVHANHPNEIADDCAESLQILVKSGIPTLNQTVLLRGVNDNADTLAELSERLVQCGVFPYYLHQLDRVQGTAHFEVSEEEGLRLIDLLRQRLPGYAVPRYVREIAGEANKSPIV